MDDSGRPQVIGADTEPSTVIQRALSAARRQLDMDVAYLAELRDGHRVYRAVDGDTLPEAVRVGTSDPMEETLAGLLVTGDLPPVLAEVASEPAAASLPEIRQARVGAYAGVQVKLPDGTGYGALVCFSHAPRPGLDRSAVGFLHLLARSVTEQLDQGPADGDGLRGALDRVERALAPGGIDMVFQPVFDIHTRSLVGAEALARFPIEPKRAPNLWFEEAGTVGRGVDLELAAVDAALSKLRELPDGSFLAVNLSAEAIVSGRLAETLAGVPSERLVLEVPERAPVEDPYALYQAMEALRATGIRLAADDAGAGFESLSRILELRPELIKFDVSLTRDVDSDPVRQALASSLVSFARQFEAMVVAEGIETEAELEALRELGFGYGQGYYLGRPEPLPLASTIPA
jgi:EAL domain-containing protein (putative c-di-GMP-specific phosphodiesterase class I)